MPLGDTIQQGVGSFGPIGKLIQMGSKAGESATAGSDSGAVRGLGQAVFNPARNIDALSDPDISAGGKALGLLFPGAGEMFRKDKNRPEVPLEDPAQIERLSRLDRIAKNIEEGTDAATRTGQADVARNVAQTQSRLARATGGATGATVDALIKSQRTGDQAAGQVASTSKQQLPAFMSLAQRIADNIEKRKFDLQRVDQAQFMLEKARREGDENLAKQGQEALQFARGENRGDNLQSLMSNFSEIKNRAQGDVTSLPTTEISPIEQGASATSIVGSPAVSSGGGIGGGTTIDPSFVAGLFGG